MERGTDIWVVGAGDAGRRRQVAKAFRREKIVAIGPSKDIEAVEDEVAAQEREAGRKLGSREPGMLRRFAREEADGAKTGHIIILRGGTREILDVGILGDYKHDENLGIAAWDLGHVRSTNWIGLKPEERHRLEGRMRKAFWSGRFAHLGDGQNELREEVRKLVAEHDVQTPTDLPEITERLQPGEFVTRVEEKASTDRIDDTRLVEAIEVANSFSAGEGDYHRLEADSIAMVLVPLFKALGVELSRVRVEVPVGALGAKSGGRAKRVDLVVFGTPGIEEPILFVEVKRRWNGLDWARDQMDEYLRLTEREGSANLITDGSEIEMENVPGDASARSTDGSAEVSLQWLTESGAESLARLADYLDRS